MATIIGDASEIIISGSTDRFFRIPAVVLLLWRDIIGCSCQSAVRHASGGTMSGPIDDTINEVRRLAYRESSPGGAYKIYDRVLNSHQTR